MSERTQTDEFLTAATSGLKGDRELQLDVQAELRSHMEERQHEAEAAGATPEAAAEQAVRAMGPVADVASGIEQANRRRMRVRGLVRLAAQWLLAPLAVAIAILTTDRGPFLVARSVGGWFGGSVCTIGDDEALFHRRPLTPDQRLILRGDTTKRIRSAQQKAIWDRWPDNKVYLHNYVSSLLSDESSLGATKEQARAALDAELARLQALDPDNARFDFIRAHRLLSQAVEDKPREVKNPDGTTKTDYETVVTNRAALDEAMALFKAGLNKPEFRRYTREMALERCAILGQPTSLLEEIGQIALLAGTLLPDLAHFRNLERKALFYGELLAGEGRREDADFFLHAHLRFAPQINSDGYCLIDVLVVGAIAELGATRAPTIYEKLGDKAAAERIRTESAALAAPVKQFRERVKQPSNSRNGIVERHGGVLAAMLLPALGEGGSLTPDQLTPGRMVEYVVAEGVALALLSVALFLAMLLAVLAAIYYRWVRPGRTASLLLLPEGAEIGRLLALGVLIPLLGYYLVTRWWPWGPQEVNLYWGGWPFAMLWLSLLFLILGLLAALVRRTVSRRCRQLQLPVPPPPPRFWTLAGWTLIALLAIPGFLPGTVWGTSHYTRAGHWELPVTGVLLLWVGGALLLLTILGGLGYGIARDVRFGRRCAAYYGSLMRTAIPAIALALILVNVCSRPYLRHAERRWMARDTITCVDPNGGFTRLESRLTQRLKAEIQKAAARQ